MYSPIPKQRAELKDFLQNLIEKKEFQILIPTPEETTDEFHVKTTEKCNRAYLPCPASNIFPALRGIHLHGSQLFVRGFLTPQTPYMRLLLNWQTGTGKSIAAIGIAQKFVAYICHKLKL